MEKEKQRYDYPFYKNMERYNRVHQNKGNQSSITTYKKTADFIIKHSAIPSKNAVSTNTQHNRYFHETSNFCSIYYCGKRLYVHIFNVAL